MFGIPELSERTIKEVIIQVEEYNYISKGDRIICEVILNGWDNPNSRKKV